MRSLPLAGTRTFPPRQPWRKAVCFLWLWLSSGGVPLVWWCPTEKEPHFERCGLTWFAAAMAAKYLIVSSAQLWAAGSGTVLWAQKCKSLTQEIFFISFSGMPTFNKLGVTITPSPSAMVEAQSSHSWEGVECLVGKTTCISGRVTRLIDELNSSKVWKLNCFCEY